MTTTSQRALILYRRRRFINHLLTYLLTYLLMSSNDSRRREVTEQMWYAAEDCSRYVQRRLEMLVRRRLRVGYGEQTVPETKRNSDAFETPTLLDDEIHQWCMTVPGHEDICKPERPACNLSAMGLSASVITVGAAWCDRTFMMRRRTVWQTDRQTYRQTDTLPAGKSRYT